jgi:hypothetical protein
MRKMRAGTEFMRRQRRLVRRCLACLSLFDSEWAGERICPHCKKKSGWREGDSGVPGSEWAGGAG